jgi:hypothetical protein
MAEDERDPARLRVEGVLIRAGVPDANGVVWSSEAIRQIAAQLNDGTLTLAAEWREIDTRVTPLGVAIVRASLTGVSIVRKDRQVRDQPTPSAAPATPTAPR